MLLHRSDLNISETFRHFFSHFLAKNLQKFVIFKFFSLIFAQILMKFCRNFADNLEDVEIFWIFSFSRVNFRILKEFTWFKWFEWFEWFEWFGPSPTEPFNSGQFSRRRCAVARGRWSGYNRPTFGCRWTPAAGPRTAALLRVHGQGAAGSVDSLVERFDRRGTEPFELFTLEFGQNSWNP